MLNFLGDHPLAETIPRDKESPLKKHVWRPLFVVLGLVLAILLVRMVYVPDDFGVQARGYTFGFHRLGNEQEWKKLPERFRDSNYCAECHQEKSDRLAGGQHAMIPCENCHGAAFDHPEQPPKLVLDRSRELCLRCHSRLYMPSSDRSTIPGIDPEQHNGGSPCVDCHNPHRPSLEEM